MRGAAAAGSRRGVRRRRARARGEGTIYQRASDGRWVAALRWPTGEGKRRYARTQKDALKQLEVLKSELRAGHPPPDDRLTVGTWLDRWLEQRVSKLTYNTRTSYERGPRLHPSGPRTSEAAAVEGRRRRGVDGRPHRARRVLAHSEVQPDRAEDRPEGRHASGHPDPQPGSARRATRLP